MNGNGITRVAVVEDNPEVQEYLHDIINDEPDLECQNCYNNAEEAITFLPKANAHLIIIDIGLPGEKNGIEVVRELKPVFDAAFLASPDCPQVQFIMYTVFEKADIIFESLRVGASGYILKSDAGMHIIDALRDLREGRSPISGSIARVVFDYFQKPPEPPIEMAMLTKQESRILHLLSKGLLYKEIADQLDIKEGTVKQHIHHIYEKLHVQNRTEATVIYLTKMKKRGF
jgi:DNA-binding NarL/FixJ family response regulator